MRNACVRNSNIKHAYNNYICSLGVNIVMIHKSKNVLWKLIHRHFFSFDLHTMLITTALGWGWDWAQLLRESKSKNGHDHHDRLLCLCRVTFLHFFVLLLLCLMQKNGFLSLPLSCFLLWWSACCDFHFFRENIFYFFRKKISNRMHAMQYEQKK